MSQRFIENVSKIDVLNGNHYDAGPNAMNVVVHCQPNLRVKTKMMKVLGLTYD